VELLRYRNGQSGPAQGIKKRREKENEAERGRDPGMEAAIHAEHLSDENSWIA